MNEATGGKDRMDRLKLHRLIEHIRQQDDIRFSVEDVAEGLGELVGSFGITESFTTAERHVLTAELTEIALQYEFAEAVRIALRDPMLSWA